MAKYELPPELRAYVNGQRRYPQYDIPEEETWLLDFRQAMRSDLNHQLKGHFWISEDLSVAEDIFLGPDGQALPFVPVDLPEDLGPFKDLDSYALNLARLTTRSRFAQLGIDVKERFSGESLVLMSNYAHRPIYLSQGTATCYMYYWDGQTLRGEQLEDAIGKKIRITGVEGSEWRPWYGNSDYNPDHELRGIEFFMDPRMRKYIPRIRKIDLDEQTMKLLDGPTKNHGRHYIDKYLKKAPKIKQAGNLIISETLAQLELDSSVHGLCDTRLGFNRWPAGMLGTDDFQTNSVLLRGGNTYGPFRTETYERDLSKSTPDTVLVTFVNA
jgi:hypothetical protein